MKPAQATTITQYLYSGCTLKSTRRAEYRRTRSTPTVQPAVANGVYLSVNDVR